MKPRLLYIRMLRSRPAQVVCSLWQQIDRNDLFTHVAALTYTTVLSVVPLLALLLAVDAALVSTAISKPSSVIT